jgi:hypothetical protein
MQNQYAGDVGDFGKLGMIRTLIGLHPAAQPLLRLGVVWYLTPDSGNNDGRHRTYLEVARSRNRVHFEACDSDLYGALQRLSERSVHCLQRSGALPPDTIYCSDIVAVGRARPEWAATAYATVAPCEIVFVDPDNGLAPPSVEMHYDRAPKHVFLSEFSSLANTQSIVIYHHLGRNGSADEQIERRLKELASAFPNRPAGWGLRFRRGTSRVFFVVPAIDHQSLLWERAQALLSGGWGLRGHFEVVRLPETRSIGANLATA